MADLPRNVRRFIADHINSVEQLEVLLLLRRTPDRSLTPVEIAKSISTTPASIEVRLRDLVRSELVAAEGEGFRFADDARRREALAELADCYAKLRVRVITEIFSQPSEAVRSFSDAFRLRDDE